MIIERLMKQLTLTILSLVFAMTVVAQEQQRPPQQKFSPERFQAELEQYITKHACLTQKEAAKFFPIYKEMQCKQRAIFDRQRQLDKMKPADEKGCETAIRQRDEYDLELKRIQQTYHNKFLTVLSASKLYDVLKAENGFHRQKLRNAGHRGDKKKENK